MLMESKRRIKPDYTDLINQYKNDSGIKSLHKILLDIYLMAIPKYIIKNDELEIVYDKETQALIDTAQKNLDDYFKANYE